MVSCGAVHHVHATCPGAGLCLPASHGLGQDYSGNAALHTADLLNQLNTPGLNNNGAGNRLSSAAQYTKYLQPCLVPPGCDSFQHP